MSSFSNSSTILLGVGGGVAAYKAVEVASALHKKQYNVEVAMTASAQKFVTQLTFSAVTNRAVLTDIFPAQKGGEPRDIYPHLFPATTADVCVILPATADLIAKICYGHGDDIVSASVLSLRSTCHRYFCPSMNVDMWNQQIVRENVERMKRLGWRCIGPDSGHLACGAVGAGRMAEPGQIIQSIDESIHSRNVLSGKTVMILSGPTVEHLDPVRFISNHSSGKMGKAIAEHAAASGAQVEFITGPVHEYDRPSGTGICTVEVTSADDMLDAARRQFETADVAIFVAAVADYKPVTSESVKPPKRKDRVTIDLSPTIDIAETLGDLKKPEQICVGFALETGADGLNRAREKLCRKHLDAIVLNGIESFGSEHGQFQFLTRHAPDSGIDWGDIPKSECAARLLGEITTMLSTGRAGACRS